MLNETDRQPFRKLGDQQLLDQTQRLAANKRALEVHILDHLAEIDRRRLALRRGFSSLFDYAVRELGFSDASAQRRIQTMRLCRRHHWVRADLQSGKLNLTSAAQWETDFARAEQQSRQQTRGAGVRQRWETARLPANGARDAGESDLVAPKATTAATTQAPVAQSGAPAESSDSAVSTDIAVPAPWAPPVTPAASTPIAAGEPIEPVAALSRTPAAAGAVATDDRGIRDSIDAYTNAGSMATKPNSARRGPQPADAGGAPGGGQRLLDVVEARLHDDVQTRSAPPIAAAGAVAMAPDPPANAAPCTPPSLRDLPPTGELSDVVAPAPLLDPQRQRELIKQASGMSTRELAGVIAAVAPDGARPRDTLRATGSGRYTLKVNIDEECERGLRLLKDLLSHLDPRISWGDLVARVVSEAVERHDPRRGGRSRRRRAGSGDASSQRKQPSGRGAGRTERRSPRAGGLVPAPRFRSAATHRRRDQSAVPAAAGSRHNPVATATSAAAATPAPKSKPAAIHRRRDHSAVPAAAASRCNPVATATSAATTTPAPKCTTGATAKRRDPSALAPRATERTRRSATRRPPASSYAATGAPPTSAAATPPPKAPPVTSAKDAGRVVSSRGTSIPATTPESTRSFPPDKERDAGALPNTTSAPEKEPAAAATHDRDLPRSARRRTIPATVRRFVWQRDQGRCCYRDPITGRRCNSSHLLQIDHLLPVAQGGGADPGNLRLACFAHHRLRHRDESAPRPERRR